MITLASRCQRTTNYDYTQYLKEHEESIIN